MSYGIYELTSYIGWKKGGTKLGGHDITYKQYNTMQADFQRSRFWRKEYGGYLTKDGGVTRAPASARHNYGVDLPSPPDDAFASYHTHWDYEGHEIYVDSNADIFDFGEKSITERYHSDYDLQFDKDVGLSSIVINRYDASVSYGKSLSFFVISRQLFLRYFLFFML